MKEDKAVFKVDDAEGCDEKGDNKSGCCSNEEGLIECGVVSFFKEKEGAGEEEDCCDREKRSACYVKFFHVLEVLFFFFIVEGC